MSWFKNLKRWQKGGLISGAVGLLIACLLMLLLVLGILLPSRQAENVGWYIVYLHHSLYLICGGIIPVLAVAIVTVYGGFGALMGVIQQMANPLRRWGLTGLLALFLPFIYWFNYQLAMALEHA
jgi:hypothetical protein